MCVASYSAILAYGLKSAQGCMSLELELPRVGSFLFQCSSIRIDDLKPGILIIRTWAVWGKDKRVIAILFSLFLAAGSVICYVMVRFLGSMECELFDLA